MLQVLFFRYQTTQNQTTQTVREAEEYFKTHFKTFRKTGRV